MADINFIQFYQKMHKLLGKLALYTFLASVVGGCANKNLNTSSNNYYHAPAQAYNLYLGNGAIHGQPTMYHQCSPSGSTLQVIDAGGDFFKIDVFNLLADSTFDTTSDKTAATNRLIDYYSNQYSAAYHPPIFSLKNKGQAHIYAPLPLDQPSRFLKRQRVVGLLAFKQGNLLYVVQHAQRIYNQKQMTQKLITLKNAMAIPGSFDSANSITTDQADRPIGVININPNQASPEQIDDWRRTARCFNTSDDKIYSEQNNKSLLERLHKLIDWPF